MVSQGLGGPGRCLRVRVPWGTAGPPGVPASAGPPGQPWRGGSLGYPQQCRSRGPRGVVWGPQGPLRMNGTPPGMGVQQGTTVSTGHPRRQSSLGYPMGGGSPGDPPHAPQGILPSHRGARGPMVLLHGASRGGGGAPAARAPTQRHASGTLTTRPQTHGEHPKAGFEKCSRVPAPAAAQHERGGRTRPCSRKQSPGPLRRAVWALRAGHRDPTAPTRPQCTHIAARGGKPEPGQGAEPCTDLSQLRLSPRVCSRYFGCE